METSDDFYSTMGVLIQDVLTGNVIDCQTLMQVKFPMHLMINLQFATFFDESFGLFLADVLGKEIAAFSKTSCRTVIQTYCFSATITSVPSISVLSPWYR